MRVEQVNPNEKLPTARANPPDCIPNYVSGWARNMAEVQTARTRDVKVIKVIVETPVQPKP
jgi:hypothetical protein